MELAVEAAQSRHLPDFLEQFALRATRMLDAIWGGVAVYRGRETELHSGNKTNGATLSACRDWLLGSARESRNEVDARAVPKEIADAFEGAAHGAAHLGAPHGLPHELSNISQPAATRHTAATIARVAPLRAALNTLDLMT